MMTRITSGVGANLLAQQRREPRYLCNCAITVSCKRGMPMVYVSMQHNRLLNLENSACWQSQQNPPGSLPLPPPQGFHPPVGIGALHHPGAGGHLSRWYMASSNATKCAQ
ncbi:unnamed protein product [Sphagnum jensenii]|uniref:Uncharacterized protein n=1 Tax=Sphagnum jensenii TaxID=128206 RepID=A0ABP0W4P6_9BRYO